MKSLWMKLGVLGGLVLLLLLPLSMINGLVSHRQQYRSAAIASVEAGAAGEQLLAGPVLVLPYRFKVVTTVNDQQKVEWHDSSVKLLPDKLTVSGELKPFSRQRGIYQARLYQADLLLTGEFSLPQHGGFAADSEIVWERPFLSVGIQDVRGINATPTAMWGGGTLEFQPGANLLTVGNGVHAKLPAYTGQASVQPFRIKLNLTGMDEFAMLPLGHDTEMALNSSWRHPSFSGQLLPKGQPEISAAGFRAQWRTSRFATNVEERFKRCDAAERCTLSESELPRMAVRLIDPVDVYLQTDRAVKYGFLFVFLTFGVFFLTEVMKRISVHPVQYGLVGMSLAVFFLLLLSLAEQLGFALAYVLAASACVLQNGFYVRYALGGWARGAGFALLLGTLYGLLYVLLNSEDHALMLGSLLLFALLTVVMVLTRKLDWYGVGRPDQVEPAEEAA